MSEVPFPGTDSSRRYYYKFAEQHLHCQTRMNGSIAVGLLAATLACPRGLPAHPVSNQIVSEPWRLSWLAPGLVGGGVGLLMHPSYHAGFTR
jgi:hypothetical protein